MSEFHLNTYSPEFRLARLVNSTDAGYRTVTSILGRDNAPTGDGSNAAQATSKCILEACALTGAGCNNVMPNGILICPFGTGADTNTFLMRVLGWNLIAKPGTDPATWEWKDILLGEYTCSLSTPTGVSGGIIGTSNLYCDTIAIVGTSGSANAHDIVSPATDLTGTVLCDIKGSHRVELNFSRNGPSAASCNALYKWVY